MEARHLVAGQTVNRPTRSVSKRAMRLLVVPIMTLTLLVLSSTPASAGGWAYTFSNSGGSYIRARPTTNSMYYVYVGNYTQVYLYCWVDGQWAYGNYWTNRWFQSSVPGYRYGSPEAYIHASLIPQSAQPSLPRC